MNKPPIKFHPRKRFGQHFLRDQMVLQKIVGAIQPKPDDQLVEIGPGEGALTRYLLPLVEHLVVIEIDRDLIKALEQLFSSQRNLTIHEADALSFNFTELTTAPHKLRIVGNLPYNISTPLLFKLLTHLDAIKDMYFLLQKEVVERLTATVGSKHYGRLGVMTQYFCENTAVFDVDPQAFTPPPKVNSSLIRMIPLITRQQKAQDLTVLSKVVKQAFNYRRKTLTNSLKPLISQNQLVTLNIDPSCRAQELSVDDYVRISNSIAVKSR